jgi:hypothetical protein
MKNIITLLLLVFGLFQATAQQPKQGPPTPPQKGVNWKLAKEQQQKMEMYKVQFVTKKLQLSKEEAEAFWPVYEANRREVQEIVKTKIGDEIALQEAMLNAKKKLKISLKPILKTDDRINQALKIDREFLNRMKGEMGKRKAAMGKRKGNIELRKRKPNPENRRDF